MVELLMGQRSTVSDELKDKLEEAIDEAYNALELPSGYTFSQIAEEVDSITDNLRTMNELVEKFNENGGLTLDEFTDLAKILDSINVENLYSISDLEGGINYVSMYTKALEDLYSKYFNENSAQKDKDEAAIEAGKLLVKEILFNTDDRTNLISKCEKGGVLNDTK